MRKLMCLLALLSAMPAYGSTFSENEFPFQHDFCPSSSNSDGDELITKENEETKWKKAEEKAKQLDEWIYREECKGIKIEKNETPFNVAKSTVLRVSSYYRSQLRWLVRRMGSDKALTTFIECYTPDYLSAFEEQRFENIKVSFPFSSTEDLVRQITDAYMSRYIGGSKNPNMTLTSLLAGDLPNFRLKKSFSKVFSAEELMVFMTQFMPQLKDADKTVDPKSDQAYGWMLFAYEKACIYFMKDYANALREHIKGPYVDRYPFRNLVGEQSAQLYIPLKPLFKKGYKPKNDEIAGYNGSRPSRFEIREKRLVPNMGDLYRESGVSHMDLVPDDISPDDQNADDEELLIGSAKI